MSRKTGSHLPLFRVWREDGRYRLVHAKDERAAFRMVRRATKVVLVSSGKVAAS